MLLCIPVIYSFLLLSKTPAGCEYITIVYPFINLLPFLIHFALRIRITFPGLKFLIIYLAFAQVYRTRDPGEANSTQALRVEHMWTITQLRW